ncbi:unnamed protein product, partial [Didymodactylos carnosus]
LPLMNQIEMLNSLKQNDIEFEMRTPTDLSKNIQSMALALQSQKSENLPEVREKLITYTIGLLRTNTVSTKLLLEEILKQDEMVNEEVKKFMIAFCGEIVYAS